MAGATNAVENKLLDMLCGGTGYTITSPTLALVSVAVTESDTAGTITKVSYTGYADHAIVNATDFNNASAGSKDNKVVISFPVNTGGGSATAVGFAVINNGTDVVLYGTVSSLTISTNVTPQFDIGALVLTAD